MNHPAGDEKSADGNMADDRAPDDQREDVPPIPSEPDEKADAHATISATTDEEPFVRSPDNWDAAETEKTGDAPKSNNKLPF